MTRRFAPTQSVGASEGVRQSVGVSNGGFPALAAGHTPGGRREPGQEAI